MNKIVTYLILIFFGGIFLSNSWNFSPWGGYDKDLHFAYAKILTFEKRIPTYDETPESYNPPPFYYLSGKLAQVFSPFFNDDFIESLKSWQMLVAGLVVIAGLAWWDIFNLLNRHKAQFSWLFIIWLLSLPVLNKMIPMYNLETTQFVLTSFIIWYFIKFFLPKPTFNRIIILGLISGLILSFRLMSFTLLLSLGLTIIYMAVIKKISWKKMLTLNLVFTLITLIIGGQFYYLYKDNGAFGEKMEDMAHISWWKRQPKTFYTDTFFRTTMRRPIRPNFPNRFIPIFYYDFWGDYWNYFPQRRFGYTISDLRKDRQLISPERLNRLAWQNRVNLIPTLIIAIGYLSALFSIAKKQTKIGEILLMTFFMITFLAFFYMNHKFANLYKGDTIKASYMLYALPTLIFFAVKQLISWQSIKIIFYPILFAVILAIGFNIEFIFF